MSTTKEHVAGIAMVADLLGESHRSRKALDTMIAGTGTSSSFRYDGPHNEDTVHGVHAAVKALSEQALPVPDIQPLLRKLSPLIESEDESDVGADGPCPADETGGSD